MAKLDSWTNLKGSMTALVTPFRDGEVDLACLSRLVERQIEGGTDWLVPLGTTGESPVLSEAERELVLEGVLATVNKRRPVMAGTGSNCTRSTIEHSRREWSGALSLRFSRSRYPSSHRCRSVCL